MLQPNRSIRLLRVLGTALYVLAAVALVAAAGTVHPGLAFLVAGWALCTFASQLAEIVKGFSQGCGSGDRDGERPCGRRNSPYPPAPVGVDAGPLPRGRRRVLPGLSAEGDARLRHFPRARDF